MGKRYAHNLFDQYANRAMTSYHDSITHSGSFETMSRWLVVFCSFVWLPCREHKTTISSLFRWTKEYNISCSHACIFHYIVVSSHTDGQTLPINRRQKAYNNGTLIIEQLQRTEDAGTYTCMAQNKQKQTARRNVEIQVLSKFCRTKSIVFFHLKKLKLNSNALIRCAPYQCQSHRKSCQSNRWRIC